MTSPPLLCGVVAYLLPHRATPPAISPHRMAASPAHTCAACRLPWNRCRHPMDAAGSPHADRRRLQPGLSSVPGFVWPWRARQTLAPSGAGIPGSCCVRLVPVRTPPDGQQRLLARGQGRSHRALALGAETPSSVALSLSPSLRRRRSEADAPRVADSLTGKWPDGRHPVTRLEELARLPAVDSGERVLGAVDPYKPRPPRCRRCIVLSSVAGLDGQMKHTRLRGVLVRLQVRAGKSEFTPRACRHQ